jgi:hypothetical protein
MLDSAAAMIIQKDIVVARVSRNQIGFELECLAEDRPSHAYASKGSDTVTLERLRDSASQSKCSGPGQRDPFLVTLSIAFVDRVRTSTKPSGKAHSSVCAPFS